MPLPSVTEETPAVSERSSNFLPTDEKYRLTGEMPSESERDPREIREENREERARKEKTPAKEGESATPAKDASTEDAPAASASETAAASAAAPPQKKPNSENRWQKRERELREAREEIARLKAQSSQPQPRSATQQASQPVTETKAKAVPKPKIDDVDPKTNEPKFKSYADFEEARDSWLLEEGARRAQDAIGKTQREQQQSQAEQVLQQTVNERVASVRKMHADYDDAVQAAITEKDEHGQDVLFFPARSPIDGFILNAKNGHEVLYHVAKNIQDPAIREIFARDARGNYLLNPIEQVSRLAVISHTLAGKTSSGAGNDASQSSAKPITQASRPAHQVSGTGTVAKDAVEQALEDGDFETYQRTQNAKDLARLKKK